VIALYLPWRVVLMLDQADRWPGRVRARRACHGGGSFCRGRPFRGKREAAILIQKSDEVILLTTFGLCWSWPGSLNGSGIGSGPAR